MNKIITISREYGAGSHPSASRGGPPAMAFYYDRDIVRGDWLKGQRL